MAAVNCSITQVSFGLVLLTASGRIADSLVGVLLRPPPSTGFLDAWQVLVCDAWWRDRIAWRVERRLSGG